MDVPGPFIKHPMETAESWLQSLRSVEHQAVLQNAKRTQVTSVAIETFCFSIERRHTPRACCCIVK